MDSFNAEQVEVLKKQARLTEAQIVRLCDNHPDLKVFPMPRSVLERQLLKRPNR
jgi:hypothetical protein